MNAPTRDPEALAEDLLRRTDSTELPVDVELIAAETGVTVLRNRHKGPEACFALHDPDFALRTGRQIIGVNIATSPRRVRWLIAHALGHMLLHDRPLITCYSVMVDTPAPGSSAATPTEETQATQFAAVLLMPAELVLAELAHQVAAGHSSRDAMLATIAATCEVSNEAIGYRLITMGAISG